MNIPGWIFDECKRLGYIKNRLSPLCWDKGINPAWMIFKLILIDRKRRKKELDDLKKQVVSLYIGNTRLIDSLMDMCNQHCAAGSKENVLDAGHLSSNEDALSLLEDAGMAETEDGYNYTMHWDKINKRMAEVKRAWSGKVQEMLILFGEIKKSKGATS